MTLILSKTQLMLRYQQLSTYSNLFILLDDYQYQQESSQNTQINTQKPLVNFYL
jgi:hypothetical protein